MMVVVVVRFLCKSVQSLHR